MHLLDLFGRSKVKWGDVAARLPARRTPARVVPKPVPITGAPVARAPVAGSTGSTGSPQASSPRASSPRASSIRLPPAPHDLRRLIFAAVASNDSEQLATMFRENPDGVVAHAVDWMKVPDELRPNPEAVRWYSDGLRAVAQYCAVTLNRPDLFQRIEELGLATPVVQ